MDFYQELIKEALTFNFKENPIALFVIRYLSLHEYSSFLASFGQQRAALRDKQQAVSEAF